MASTFESNRVTPELDAMLDVAIHEARLTKSKELLPVHFVLALYVRSRTPASRVLISNTMMSLLPDLAGTARKYVAQMIDEPSEQADNGPIVFSHAVNEMVEQMYLMVQMERQFGELARTGDMLHTIINMQDPQVEDLFELLGVNQWRIQAIIKRS